MPELWLPNVIRKPIPQTSTDPIIVPVGDVFHVAVSEAESLHDFFSNDGGIESTGYIRRDGTIEQYRPLNVECDAQNDGNSWVTGGVRYGYNSWETQGMGEGEWTPEQVASIQRIIAWKHDHYGTPLRLTPGWNQPGTGYHCLFPEWNRNAHSCPGPDRVRQFNNVIVPWMNQGGQETDMPLNDTDLAKIQKIADDSATAAVNAVLDQTQSNGRTLRENIRAGGNTVDIAKAIAKELGVEVNRKARK